MGSEISRIYFPTRKRDRTTISHEIHSEIILKRETGIHGPLIWSEFPEENGGSTDGRISPKKGHHGDPRTTDFVRISKRGWGIHGRPNQSEKGACGDPRTVKPIRILKLGIRDSQTAQSVFIFILGIRDPRTAEPTSILKLGIRRLQTAKSVCIFIFGTGKPIRIFKLKIWDPRTTKMVRIFKL